MGNDTLVNLTKLNSAALHPINFEDLKLFKTTSVSND